jgi:hypothetical protein
MNGKDDDVRSRFRHEARTILNHVVGFGELLAGDSSPLTAPELDESFKAIGAAAIALRQPVLAYLASILDGSEPSDVLRLQVYERIYDLVSLVQSTKRFSPAGTKALEDIHKVHEAVNALSDLFESADAFSAIKADSAAFPAASSSWTTTPSTGKSSRGTSSGRDTWSARRPTGPRPSRYCPRRRSTSSSST